MRFLTSIDLYQHIIQVGNQKDGHFTFLVLTQRSMPFSSLQDVVYINDGQLVYYPCYGVGGENIAQPSALIMMASIKEDYIYLYTSYGSTNTYDISSGYFEGMGFSDTVARLD